MVENISVKDALRLALNGKGKLLYIRSEKAYRKGHLPTAIRAEEEDILDFFQKYPNQKIILYCDFGNQSLMAARRLDQEGYEAYSIVGGYRAYEGYVEKKKDEMWTMEWKKRGHF